MVEQDRRVEARAGGDLGHGALGGGQLDRAGAAAVHELELGHLRHRRHDLGPALAHVLQRGGLHLADRQVLDRLAGDVVADAGDLALVGHQPDQLDPLAAVDLARERRRLLARADRRALRPDLHDAAERPPRGVDVHRDPDRRDERARGRLDHVEVLGAVHHHDRGLVGVLGGQPGEPGQAPGVGGRVGEHQVALALLPEPERLGQREGQESLEAAVQVEQPAQERAAAHRLAGDPDRLAGRALQHVGGVRPDGVEVDEGERGLDALRRPARSARRPRSGVGIGAGVGVSIDALRLCVLSSSTGGGASVVDVSVSSACILRASLQSPRCTPERWPSGLRHSPAKRVGGSRSLEGSNPSLSARILMGATAGGNRAGLRDCRDRGMRRGWGS